MEKFDQFGIRILRIDFNFVDSWLNLGICEKVPEQLGVEIGNADALRQPFRHKLLHLLPKHMQWLLGLRIIAKGKMNQI